jgi:hypothetical protein
MPITLCSFNQLRFWRSFHGDNTGSNPVGDAKQNQELTLSLAFHFQAQFRRKNSLRIAREI